MPSAKYQHILRLIASIFAAKGNTASGYKSSDSIENEVWQDMSRAAPPEPSRGIS